ncbi:MAG: lysophospholipase [Aureispira sp.]
MKHTEFSWKNPKGTKIYAQAWWPDAVRYKKPKAIIVLVHGLGEHSSRYEHVATYFAAKGVGIITCDHAGHGKSGGKRGHVAKYAYLYDEIEKLYAEATRRYSSVPVFLYGHSMGGGLVLDYILNKKHTSLKGVIATSPMLEAAFEAPKFLLKIARLVRPIYPGFSQDNGLEQKFLSKDPAVIETYNNDPLVHSKITVETALSMIDSGQNSLKIVGKIKTPLLLLHGDQDGITSHKATERFAQKASGDVTLHLWEGGYHELHNEPEQREILEYVYNWIRRHL